MWPWLRPWPGAAHAGPLWVRSSGAESLGRGALLGRVKRAWKPVIVAQIAAVVAPWPGAAHASPLWVRPYGAEFRLAALPVSEPWVPLLGPTGEVVLPGPRVRLPVRGALRRQGLGCPNHTHTQWEAARAVICR